MRWFKAQSEAPRLLSLSPLQAEEDCDGASFHLHATARLRDMSPVRWVRRKSSSSESERNCYNVQTSEVTTGRASKKKDKKRIQEERRRICEKRNPLLDRVKSTRLSFLKDRDSEDDLDESLDGSSHSRSTCESGRNRFTYDLRRSVGEPFQTKQQISEEEKTKAKRKRRSKSHSRLSYAKPGEERLFLFGFGTSTPQKQSLVVDEPPLSPKSGQGYRKSTRDHCESHVSEVSDSFKESSHFDSITPSSCLAAKFRAIQDRYLKSSTNRLIAKIYKKEGKDKDRRRLRSFSYGTLPGLEELRTNPLYKEQEQDDNDSGILDNDSATSSLLDDRYGSGTSEPLTSVLHDSLSSFPPPPRLPPRRASAPIAELEKNLRLCQHSSVLDANPTLVHPSKSSSLRKTVARNVSLGIEKNPLSVLSRSKSQESPCLSVAEELGFENMAQREESKVQESGRKSGLTVVRSRSYKSETMVVKLPRETPDQCLGIFIAKTPESNPGYLVAHVVPDGLADREGTLKIGDEILIVNGKRLRGLSMAEARKILGSGSAPGIVDIVISRYCDVNQPKRLKESSVDYENISVENGHSVIVQEPSPQTHFRKHQSKHYRDRKNESSRSISSEKSCINLDNSSQNVSNFCTFPRRPRSTMSTFHTVVFEKGNGKKSLGFTIVGGRDSPKGSIGIFIKSVLPGGQAAEDGRLRAGDEILAVNGQVCHDLTHREAVQLFRNTKSGPVALHICRRVKQREIQMSKAKSCADLLLADT